MLMALTLIPSLWHLYHPEGIGFGSGYEMASIAKNLATHGTFGDPFYPLLTGPTAVVPPLYPFFLAVCIKFLKTPVLIVWVIIGASIVTNAGIAALLPRVSAALFADSLPGVYGAVLWLSACRLMPNWDASFTMIGLMWFCLVSCRMWEHNRRALVSGALAGAIAGLLFLMNPASLLVFVPFAVFQLSVRGVRWTDYFGYISTLALVVVLFSLPWLLRNYRLWGAVVVRTNLGMTLYSSNNSCAQPSLVMSRRTACYDSRHPVGSDSEAALLRTLGEVKYDRMRTADALRWIKDNPRDFGRLTVRRIGQFWFPFPTEPRCFSYGVWLITALSIPGLILMALKGEKATWFVVAVSLVYPLMYYVVVSDVRYRYPILWLSLLPAGYGLHALGAFAQRPGPIQLRWLQRALLRGPIDIVDCSRKGAEQ